VCATFCFVEFVYLILVLTNAIIRGEGLEKKLKSTPLRPVADSPVRDRQARQVKRVWALLEKT